MLEGPRSRRVRWPGRWSMLSLGVALCGLLLATRPEAVPPRQASRLDAGAKPQAAVPHWGAPSSSGGLRTTTAQAGTTTPATTPAAPSPAPAPAALASTGASSTAPGGEPQGQAPAPQSVQATRSSSLSLSGWLEGPTSVSATYPLGAGAGRRATARWASSATLVLSATCDGSRSSASGGSGLSLVLLGSSCEVTIEGPSDVVRTSFAIEVG